MLIELENRNATLDDVARLAGVAKSTASAALNGKTGKYAVTESKRLAVLQAAQELNFQANPHAKRLSSGRDEDTIGIFTLDIDSGVGMQKLREIQLLLTREGYSVPIYSSGAPEIGDPGAHARLMASMRLQKPRAVVMASPYSLETEVEEELRRYQSEGGLVIIYDYKVNLECDHVLLDRTENTYLATRHLLELGHRKIGFYLNGVGPLHNNVRYIGFMRAMKEYGGEARPEWSMHGGTYETGTLQEGGGVFLAQQFLKWPDRPTALCIVNDISAIAFISTIGRSGLRVPQDVSVVGHDDSPLSAIFPIAITTVTHPVREIAAEVVKMLLSRLRGEYDGPPRCVDVKSQLRIRESTANLF